MENKFLKAGFAFTLLMAAQLCNGMIAVEKDLAPALHACVQKLELVSPYAQLIVALSSEDLRAILRILHNDLYKGLPVGSLDRHIVFLKSVIAKVAARPENYTPYRLEWRINSFESIDQTRKNECQALDIVLRDVFIPTSEKFAQTVACILADYLSLARMNFPVCKNSLVNNSRISLNESRVYECAQQLSAVPEFYRNYIFRGFSNLLYAFKGDESLVRTSFLRNEINFKKYARNPEGDCSIPRYTGVLEANALQQLEKALRRLSDETLAHILYLTFTPFVNPVLAQGLLLKVLLEEQKATFVRKDREWSIRLIVNLISDQRIGNRESRLLKSNVALFAEELESYLLNINTNKHSAYKHVVLKLSGAQKDVLKELIAAYRVCKFIPLPEPYVPTVSVNTSAPLRAPRLEELTESDKTESEKKSQIRQCPISPTKEIEQLAPTEAGNRSPDLEDYFGATSKESKTTDDFAGSAQAPVEEEPIDATPLYEMLTEQQDENAALQVIEGIIKDANDDALGAFMALLVRGSHRFDADRADLESRINSKQASILEVQKKLTEAAEAKKAVLHKQAMLRANLELLRRASQLEQRVPELEQQNIELQRQLAIANAAAEQAENASKRGTKRKQS